MIGTRNFYQFFCSRNIRDRGPCLEVWVYDDDVTCHVKWITIVVVAESVRVEIAILYIYRYENYVVVCHEAKKNI
jgi:hypothetical protein